MLKAGDGYDCLAESAEERQSQASVLREATSS